MDLVLFEIENGVGWNEGADEKEADDRDTARTVNSLLSCPTDGRTPNERRNGNGTDFWWQFACLSVVLSAASASWSRAWAECRMRGDRPNAKAVSSDRDCLIGLRLSHPLRSLGIKKSRHSKTVLENH